MIGVAAAAASWSTPASATTSGAPIPAWNQRQGPFLARPRGGGLPGRVDRHRALHAPPRRPRRLEHAARGRALGADLPERALPVRARASSSTGTPRATRRTATCSATRCGRSSTPGSSTSWRATTRSTDEVRLEPTPGHTPGHVSVRIASRGEEAVITGDLMHHPVQIAHPDWAQRADVDPAQARRDAPALPRALRRTARCSCSARTSPGRRAGRLVRDGDAYRLEV